MTTYYEFRVFYNGGSDISESEFKVPDSYVSGSIDNKMLYLHFQYNSTNYEFFRITATGTQRINNRFYLPTLKKDGYTFDTYKQRTGSSSSEVLLDLPPYFATLIKYNISDKYYYIDLQHIVNFQNFETYVMTHPKL